MEVGKGGKAIDKEFPESVAIEHEIYRQSPSNVQNQCRDAPDIVINGELYLTLAARWGFADKVVYWDTSAP